MGVPYKLIGKLLGKGTVVAYKTVETGGVKVLVYKVMTVSGKVTFVTIKLIGAAIVGMTLSNLWMGG